MKKPVDEPDFIGGQGSLTPEESLALSHYFATKKQRKERQLSSISTKKRQRQRVPS